MLDLPFARCTGVQYPVFGTRYSHRTGQNGPGMAPKGPFDPPRGSGATFERSCPPCPPSQKTARWNMMKCATRQSTPFVTICENGQRDLIVSFSVQQNMLAANNLLLHPHQGGMEACELAQQPQPDPNTLTLTSMPWSCI